MGIVILTQLIERTLYVRKSLNGQCRKGHLASVNALSSESNLLDNVGSAELDVPSCVISFLPQPMRKVASTILLTLILIPVVTYAQTFADVSESNPYISAISWAKETGILQGYSDGTFKPDKPVNRAEFLKIVLEAKGVDVSNATSDRFKDVPYGVWFEPYVTYARQEEFVEGYGDGFFKPEQTVSFAEGLKMAYEVLEVPYFDVSWGWYEELMKELKLSLTPPNEEPADLPKQEWYEVYVNHAKANSILFNTEINLHEGMSRKDVVWMVHSIMTHEGAWEKWSHEYDPSQKDLLRRVEKFYNREKARVLELADMFGNSMDATSRQLLVMSAYNIIYTAMEVTFPESDVRTQREINVSVEDSMKHVEEGLDMHREELLYMHIQNAIEYYESQLKEKQEFLSTKLLTKKQQKSYDDLVASMEYLITRLKILVTLENKVTDREYEELKETMSHLRFRNENFYIFVKNFTFLH